MDGREAVTTEFVQKHLDAAAQWLAAAWRARQEHSFIFFPRNIQSPLEAVFLAWWGASETLSPSSSLVDLFPQHDVEIEGQRYRIDFAMMPGARIIEAASKHRVTFRAVAIELDGHDFHEKTKEQATYRNRRDRALQNAGWTVFHFSGSEMHRSPIDCIKQANRVAHEIALSIQSEIIARGGYEDVFEA